MHVQFKTEGGVAYFPGLSKPVTLDSADLPQAEADALQHLVEAAHFFDLPAEARALRRGAADYHQYTITIEDGQRHHTIRLADPIDSPELQALVAFLREKTRPR
jgi:emfourin